jgi:cell division septum initiation protein DivIVA
MSRATEIRSDIAATVVSLAAEATELEARVNELRRQLVHLAERMRTISDALQQLPPSSAVVSNASVGDGL